MFRKYNKTYRILVPQIDVKGKHYLSDKDTKKLLSGRIVVTEKLDGANTGIIRNKNDFRLQKRGSLVDASEHYQFNFFKAWSNLNYDKLMKLPVDTILYGELMICKHKIFYNQLPDYFLAFGLYYTKQNKFAEFEHMKELCGNIGISTVPKIMECGKLYKDELSGLIPNPSSFSDEKAEGIVIWNYSKQMRGKVVREDFVKGITRHWTKEEITKNKLKG